MSSIPERNMAGSGEQTPLQMHAAFFDRNNDGIVYPWETFQGLRAIGCGILLSLPVSLIINGFLALKTKTGIIPSPLLPIYVKNIQKGKHGSDTDSYDSEGRFVPAKFEEIFQKHAHTNPNALTSDEISELLADDREPNDYVGWAAAFLEWRLLYFLCKDKNGFLQKDTARAVYDGSLFVQLEKERASSQKNKA